MTTTLEECAWHGRHGTGKYRDHTDPANLLDVVVNEQSAQLKKRNHQLISLINDVVFENI